MTMTNPDFVYTVYIKTTPERLWNAITNPEFTRQYWGGENISDWKKGSKWQHVGNDAQRTVKLVGEVLESVPSKHLVLSWPEPSDAADKPRHSRVTFEIEQIGEMVRLNVIHSSLRAGSEMERRIAAGWPRVLSSMKSFLETGEALNTWAGYEYDCAKPATPQPPAD
jgi:uncharacterized protein YndB with AHSA1/START domain